MTAGFAFLAVGTLMFLSAVKNRSIAEILQDFTATEAEPGPGDRGFIAALTSTASTATSGFVDGLTPNSPGGVMGGKLNAKGQKQKEAQLKRDFPGLKPGIRTVAAIVLLRFPDLTITSQVRPGDDGRHGEGRAVDIGGPAATMGKAAKWINRYLYKMLDEGIHNNSQGSLSVDTKKRVPASFWGSKTWSDHRDHIHLAV